MSAVLAFLSAASTAVALAGLLDAAVCHAAARRRMPRAGGRHILLLAALGRRLRPAGASPDLRARIAAAGRPAGLGERDLMAAKVAGAVVGSGLAVPLVTAVPGRLGFVLAVVVPLAGFFTPDRWLARRAAERARRVRRQLPAMLDLLRVTVEAGGSLAAALRSVGERSEGPLAREWRAVGREVQLGVPLAEALDALSHRLPQPEVRALVAALERSRRHGAPLAATLAAQAQAARFALGRRVRDDAARAGPKLQLVVALLLVPSVLLLVAAALASALLDGSADAVPL